MAGNMCPPLLLLGKAIRTVWGNYIVKYLECKSVMCQKTSHTQQYFGHNWLMWLVIGVMVLHLYGPLLNNVLYVFRPKIW